MTLEEINAIFERLKPAGRNVISYGSGVLTAVGVMSLKDQQTLLEAITHIGDDISDIIKYLGIIGGITMPIWAHLSSSVIAMLTSLRKKAPDIKVVASPEIASKTPDNVLSNTQVAVVDKVSGQSMSP